MMEDKRKRARSVAKLQAPKEKVKKNESVLYFSAWAGAVSTILIGWNIDSIGTGVACILAGVATLGIVQHITGGTNERD